jgi:hypothetical protein
MFDYSELRNYIDGKRRQIHALPDVMKELDLRMSSEQVYEIEGRKKMLSDIENVILELMEEEARK